MHWLTLRSPAKERYSLTDQPGYLKLTCSVDKATGRGVPALITRRIQHHKFECSTQLIFTPAADDAAGILLLKDESHQYFLSVGMSPEGKEISLFKIAPAGEDTIASKLLQPDVDRLGLKVISNGTHSYGKGPWELLKENVDAYFLSTANIYGFTGTTIGVYAIKTGSESSGLAVLP